MNTVTINGTQYPVINKPLWWHKAGKMQTATGYGHKLTTPYCVRYEGRERRIYAVCFSNTATLYVMVKGNKVTVTE